MVVPLLSILAIRTAGLRGPHHVVAGQVPELIAVPTVMMLAIAGLHGVGLGDYLDPVLATGIYSVAIAIGVAIAIAMLRTRLPAAVRDACPESNAKAWSSAAIPLLFVSGFAYANREMGLIPRWAVEGASGATSLAIVARNAIFGLEAGRVLRVSRRETV